MKTKMKRMASFILALMLLAGMTSCKAEKSAFADVSPDDYFYEPVKWAVERSITTGTSDTTFSPKDTCTRAQVMTFIWRAAERPVPENVSRPFDDVEAGAYYSTAVRWAYERNIATGSSGRLFRPGQPCTRAQAITFLWRAAGSPRSARQLPFQDISKSDYCYPAVCWALDKKVTTGKTDTRFDPDGICTRAEILTFLYRAWKDRDPDIEPGTSGISDGSVLKVTFLDVGQADAALVECGDHAMLIDGGNRDDSSKMYAVLKEKKIDHLDLVIASHAHEDHVGGLAGALNYATADRTLCSTTEYDSKTFASFKKYAEEKGGGLSVPKIGDSYTLGNATVTVIGKAGTDGENNSSLFVMIAFGAHRFLFTGDAERDAEKALIGSGQDIRADVLKVAHHGSNDSSTYPFLREVMPKIAVISVGADNGYGHPAAYTLSRLTDCGAAIYRTDEKGDITVISDGKELTVAAEKAG